MTDLTVADLAKLPRKEVYFRCPFSKQNKGRIVKVLDLNHVCVEAIGADGPTGWTCNVSFHDVFLKEEELKDANRRIDKRLLHQYLNNIQTVEDLVAFCLSHRVALEEDGPADPIARFAAVKKAKEFTNLCPESGLTKEEEETLYAYDLDGF